MSFPMNPVKKFFENKRDGCGCGKSAAKPAGQVNQVQVSPAQAFASPVQAAQSFQSGTLRSAPQAPVTTRTQV